MPKSHERKPPAGPKPEKKSSAVMRWVTGATAVLGLAFAVQRVVSMVSDANVRRRQVAEQLQAAAIQRASGHYQEAWNALQQGARVDESRPELRAAEEDLAMDWLRHIHANGGTFGDIVTQIQPALVRGVTASAGPRKGDLTAHLGWADFLLGRDGRGGVAPEQQYRRALEADSANPFAHAMWAHWILWQGGLREEAQRHFAAALRSGRERDYVRELQIAAATNRRDDAGDIELLRIANDIRESHEAVSKETRQKLADDICLDGSSYLRSVRSDLPRSPAVSAEADLLTVTWLLQGIELRSGQDVTRDYCVASMDDAAGKSAQALATYKSVRERLSKFSLLIKVIEARITRLQRAPH